MPNWMILAQVAILIVRTAYSRENDHRHAVKLWNTRTLQARRARWSHCQPTLGTGEPRTRASISLSVKTPRPAPEDWQARMATVTKATRAHVSTAMLACYDKLVWSTVTWALKLSNVKYTFVHLPNPNMLLNKNVKLHCLGKNDSCP